MPLALRQLSAVDAPAFRDLRLLGLQESPTAFGGAYADEQHRTVEDFAGSIANSHIVGGFIADRLVGVAGFYVMAQQKSAHRGGIWGVYVHPEARRQGVGRAVLETVIAHARDRVLQVHLSVTTGSAALRLYQQLGFEIYGTEPRALCVDGNYVDEHLMVLRFDA